MTRRRHGDGINDDVVCIVVCLYRHRVCDIDIGGIVLCRRRPRRRRVCVVGVIVLVVEFILYVWSMSCVLDVGSVVGGDIVCGSSLCDDVVVCVAACLCVVTRVTSTSAASS
jgi:hypothetical protein